MRTVTRSIGALAVSILLAAASPPTAWAAPFDYILEVRSETGAAFPLPPEQYVYLCDLCTLAEFDAVVPPAGHAKAVPKAFVPSSATVNLPTPPLGVPGSLDLVPGIPGDDFDLVAEVVQVPVDVRGFGFDPAEPAVGLFLAIAQVQRDTTFTFDSGETIHVVTDDVGNDYVLFGFNLFLSDGTTPRPEDLSQVDALSGLPLPFGWSYDSHVLGQAFLPSSGGLAHVYTTGVVATWQRVTGIPVPEPGGAVLLALSALTLATRYRRAIAAQ
jgi:hypothetical protein